MAPAISIVTPVRNCIVDIRRCLDSIHLQEFRVEHIVQDCLSTDGTSELLGAYRGNGSLTVFKEKDAGIYDGISRGMSRASGGILGWLNGDDYYCPWTFSTVDWVFRTYPQVEWITGLPCYFNKSTGTGRMGTFAPAYRRDWIQKGWYRGGKLGFLMQEGMFWRRSLWDRAGGGELIRRYRLAGDFHLWRRFAEFAELWTVAAVFGVFTLSRVQASAQDRQGYFDEVGLSGRTVEPSLAGKLLHRFASLAGGRRVIRPPLDG